MSKTHEVSFAGLGGESEREAHVYAALDHVLNISNTLLSQARVFPPGRGSAGLSPPYMFMQCLPSGWQGANDEFLSNTQYGRKAKPMGLSWRRFVRGSMGMDT